MGKKIFTILRSKICLSKPVVISKQTLIDKNVNNNDDKNNDQ